MILNTTDYSTKQSDVKKEAYKRPGPKSSNREKGQKQKCLDLYIRKIIQLLYKKTAKHSTVINTIREGHPQRL